MTADEYIANAKALATLKKIAFSANTAKDRSDDGPAIFFGMMGALALASTLREDLVDAALDRHIRAFDAGLVDDGVSLPDKLDRYADDQVAKRSPEFGPDDMAKVMAHLEGQQ
jgi:hypothetical protein